MLPFRSDTRAVEARAHSLQGLRMACDAFVCLDRQGRILDANSAAKSALGIKDIRNGERHIGDFLEKDRREDFLHWLARVQSDDAVFPHPLTFTSHEEPGMPQYRVLAYTPSESSNVVICLLQPTGAPAGALDDALGAIPVGVIYCRDNAITYANAAALRLFATPRKQFLIGRPFIHYLSQNTRPVFEKAIETLRYEGAVAPIEVEIVRIDYEVIWVELSIMQSRNADALQILLHSIHQRKKDEVRLTWLSYYDALTELPNRRLFIERLQDSLEEAKHNGSRLSILYFDLDRFKHVNDSLGHAAGDEVLRITAMRLQQVLRETDLPVRLGGDEFVALLHGADARTAREIANKLLFSLRTPYQIASRQLLLGGSIGVATFPDDGEDCDTLIRRADTAMYHAKKNRLGVYFFAHEMEKEKWRLMTIERELARPDVHHQLGLCFQAQYSLQEESGERLIGVEALLRWQHPKLGEIPPDEFIPLAEESGQMHAIFPWVIEQCARQAVRWERWRIRPPKIAINVSSTQLMQVDVAAEVIGRIVSQNAKPSWFELELTETAMMRDAETAIRIMNEWVETGISIVMDDYGTGYSSLGYIKRLPIRTIKIDRSFVHNLPDNREDAAIVHSTIAMGHTLGKRVLAEGVESEAQRAFLARAGCDAAQGFLFHRPMSTEQMTRHLAEMCSRTRTGKEEADGGKARR